MYARKLRTVLFRAEDAEFFEMRRKFPRCVSRKFQSRNKKKTMSVRRFLAFGGLRHGCAVCVRSASTDRHLGRALLGQVDDPVLSELANLSFNDAKSHIAQHSDNFETVLGECQRHRLEVEKISEKDRDVVPPLRVRRFTSTPQLGFVDDVVVRIRPDGDGSRIDVRSKSRDGQGDLGANANRIRAFSQAL